MTPRRCIVGLAAIAGLAALIATAPAQAALTVNSLSFNSLSFNALSANSLSLNAITQNALTTNGSALEQLNGVAVVGISLPATAAH